MIIQRAYSLIEVKAVEEDGEHYFFRGTATTPTPDRMKDVLDPFGARFASVIPLLWQHDAVKPVGLTTLGTPTKKGIPFDSRIPIVKEAGALKDRIDEAVQSVRYKLVAAVSVGFRVLNDAVERLKDGGLLFKEYEIMELSLVTIPAQAEATISYIKSIDREQLAASGRKQFAPVRLITPGESGTKGVKLIRAVSPTIHQE
jgi:HK97 family phage prohead protease